MEKKTDNEEIKNLVGFFSLLLKIDNRIKRRNKLRTNLICILRNIK